MKKILLTLAKTPFFFLRWINATIMHIMPATLLFIFVYRSLYSALYGTELEGEFSMDVYYIIVGISIVWGFFYAISKPSLIKVAYMLRGTTNMGGGIAGRVIMCFIYVACLLSPYSLLHLLGIFCLAETIINMIILSKSKRMTYNEILEKMCIMERGTK